MTNPLASNASHSLGLFFARLPLGIYFGIDGYNKLAGGLGNFVGTQLPHVPEFVPTQLGSAYLHLLPFAEILVALLLVLGLFTRTAGLMASLALICFILAVGFLDFQVTGRPFHHHVVFLGLALAILLVGPGRFSLDMMLRQRAAKAKARAA